MPRKKPETKAAAKAKSKGKIAPVTPIDSKAAVTVEKRLGNPAWQKGVSGNPGGLPKGLGEVKKLARTYTTEAVETLAEIMQDKGAPPAARVNAANCLLDRGYGKPVQQVEQGGPGAFSDLGDEEINAFIREKASKFVEELRTLN